MVTLGMGGCAQAGWWSARAAENRSEERRSSTATELCMALSVGRGENKQKLLKILVFVPSGSIVGFDSQCQAQIKTDISKPFVLRSLQPGLGSVVIL